MSWENVFINNSYLCTSKSKQHLRMSSILFSYFPSHWKGKQGHYDGWHSSKCWDSNEVWPKQIQNGQQKSWVLCGHHILILNFKEQYKMERQIFLKIRNYKWSHQQEVFIFKYKLCIFILKVLVTMFTSKILYWAKSSFPLKQTKKKKAQQTFLKRGLYQLLMEVGFLKIQ